MLSRIYIKNYILIDELELDFEKGLNIITGETGAGKSILINAIDIVFGAKSGKEFIKNGADKAIIELTINNKKQNVKNLFNEFGIDDYGDEIIISKEITQTNSRSRVNGCLVNQELIKILRELFIDIHSQHQAYSFLQPKFHIWLLDSYIKNPLIKSYKEDFDKYTKAQNELKNLKNIAEKTEEQIDFLRFQVEEIESAQLKSLTEDEELSNELSILENVEKLKELTGNSYWTLSGDDGSVLDALYQIKNSLTKASSMDNNLNEIESKFIDLLEEIKNISSSLRNYSSALDNDAEHMNSIQERLFLLEKLKRKYGGSLEKVIENGKTLKKDLESIVFSTQNIQEMENNISNLLQKLTIKAEQISIERKKYAAELSKEIITKLEKLELPKVRFEIHFEQCNLNKNGIDNIEFLISTNISEELKPLSKVASGGELSRVMLAIKSIFAQADNIDTIIFDEIDTGISGKTSQSVADEVKNLAKYMQIIMITHQAIIASKSDRHFYVKKNQENKTNINISILDEKEKLRAIAELASGSITEESLNFANTLLK